MNWTEVSVAVDGEAAEAVSELLRPYAHDQSVVLEQLGDASSDVADALEPTVTVKIYVSEDRDTADLRRKIEEALYHMGRLYPIPPPSFVVLTEQDWANAWKRQYVPFRVGQQLWIQPSWEPASQPNDDDVVITADEGLRGARPVPLKLGAASVLAVDTDEVAVRTAHENASRNGIESGFQVQAGSLDGVAQTGWNLVLVNILAPVIIDLVEQDNLLSYARHDGRLVLSGIIDSQLEGVNDAIHRQGGAVEELLSVRDWRTLVVAPGPTTST